MTAPPDFESMTRDELLAYIRSVNTTKRGRKPRVLTAAERVAAIEAVIECGTFTAAARTIGISTGSLRLMMEDGRFISVKTFERIRLQPLVTRGRSRFGLCTVCGAEVWGRGRRSFCSDDHHESWSAFRLHLPEYRAKHRRLVALHKVRAPRDEIERRSAERQLAGTAGTHGRWLVEGSQAWFEARRAYREGWPIFLRLPEQIKQQVAASFEKVEAAS